MASQKANLSQGFGFNRKLYLSLVCLVITMLACVSIRVIGYVQVSRAEQAKRPQLLLNTWLRDLTAFQKANGRFPVDLVELENKLWKKTKPDAPSKLTHGPHDFLSRNYYYKYYANEQVCVVWAVPQGEFAAEYNTVLVVIQPNQYDVWRGAAFDEEQIKQIPPRAALTFAEMAQLGMFKQKTNDPAGDNKRKKTGFGGLFKSNKE
jgi:hypothetical protein